MNKFFYSVFSLAAFISACHKDDMHALTDNTAPEIEVFTPQDGAKFKVGDTIHIEGRMRDNNDLHEAGIYVTNDHGSLMNCPMHVHKSKEANFDTCYIVKPDDFDHGIKLTIKAEDHDHNKNEKVLNLLVE